MKGSIRVLKGFYKALVFFRVRGLVMILWQPSHLLFTCSVEFLAMFLLRLWFGERA